VKNAKLYDPLRLANNHLPILHRLLFDKAVFVDHPYAHPKIGTQKSINQISLQDFRAALSTVLCG
jgi:hypothetical protein